MWLNGLLVFEPSLSAVVPNLVEGGGDGMEESGSQLADDSGIWVAENIRADNCQNEGAPRQVTAVITARSRAGNNTSIAVNNTLWAVAVTSTSKTSVRSRKHSHCDECSNKCKVEKYPDPSEYSTARVR